MSGSFLGPRFGEAEIQDAIAKESLVARRVEPGDVAAEVARLLAAENVIGLMQGRMEFGPRALGGRSIIADARSTKMQSVLNLKIKFRESFRPFAPSILAEATGDWFDQSYSSPFMVLVYDVLPGRRDRVPAITHVDGTGRLQTVERRANPRYYRLIEAFAEITGVPIVLNTSFNDNEPVVMTPAHAIDTFRKTRMDVLVLGNYVVSRAAGPAVASTAARASAS